VSKRIYLQLVNYNSLQNKHTKMSTSDTKLNSLDKLDAEKKISDEELFKQPPSQYGDCPICFLRIPLLETGSRYQTCCGKVICGGCEYAPVYDNQGNKVDNKKCPFCRIPVPTLGGEEEIERDKKRVEAGDPIAIFNLGCDYLDGSCGQPQDYTKALELFHRAAKLGHIEAYCNIGNAYHRGRGVEVDKKEAIRYYERAAMAGDVYSRHNLGNMEKNAGNTDRAMKHYMIAISGGYAKSLEKIKQLYTNGHATKDDYTKALQLYQSYLGEIESVQRDKAVAFNNEKYRYY